MCPGNIPPQLLIVIICHLEAERPLPAGIDLRGAFDPEFLYDLSRCTEKH